VSTGSVYRRFQDKEAMVRTALLRFLEMSHEISQANLPSERLQRLTLSGALLALSRGLVTQYRGRTGLLKALDQYLDGRADAAFRERAMSLIEANLRLVIAALFPSAIGSPRPIPSAPSRSRC
jgi:AcrR family transcriptional regulator